MTDVGSPPKRTHETAKVLPSASPTPKENGEEAATPASLETSTSSMSSNSSASAKKLSASAASFTPKALRGEAKPFVPKEPAKPSTPGPSFAPRPPSPSMGAPMMASFPAPYSAHPGHNRGPYIALGPVRGPIPPFTQMGPYPVPVMPQHRGPVYSQPLPPGPIPAYPPARHNHAPRPQQSMHKAYYPPYPGSPNRGPRSPKTHIAKAQYVPAQKATPSTPPRREVHPPVPQFEQQKTAARLAPRGETPSEETKPSPTFDEMPAATDIAAASSSSTASDVPPWDVRTTPEKETTPQQNGQVSPKKPVTPASPPLPPEKRDLKSNQLRQLEEEPLSRSPKKGPEVPPATILKDDKNQVETQPIPRAQTMEAPVPLKARALPPREDVGEWERGLQLILPSATPNIPDPAPVEGIQRYLVRELLRIRRHVDDGMPSGLPPKPPGSNVPNEIYNSDPGTPVAAKNSPPSTSVQPDREISRSRGPIDSPRPGSASIPDVVPFGRGASSRSYLSDERRAPPRGRVGPRRPDSRGTGFGRDPGSFGPSSGIYDDEDALPKRIEEDKRWKAESLQSRRANADTEEADKKIKRARGILNKLSLDKFEKLSEEFLNVGFDSEDLLREAIHVVIQKAQEEVHFSSMYAELCLMLSRTPLAALGEVEKGKRFRKFLLQTCQQEFNSDLPSRMAKIDEMELPDDEKQEKKRMAKFRYLGHMRFVGELFLKELLKEEHVHDCIKVLFGETDVLDEEKLVCLCRLLTTTGKKLELLAEISENSKKQKRMLDRYFREVKGLSEAKDQLSSRTRCLLKDLYELRQNNYVPRRAVETAKTISQVHEEVAKEEMAKVAAGAPGSLKGRKPPSSARLSEIASQDVRREKSQSKPTAPDDDGWETVPSSKKATKSTSKPVPERTVSSVSTSGAGVSSRKSSTAASSSAGSHGGSSKDSNAFLALVGGSGDSPSAEKRRKKEKKEKREKEKDGKKEKEKEKKKDRKDKEGKNEAEDETDVVEGHNIAEEKIEEQEAQLPSLATSEQLLRRAKSILADWTAQRNSTEALECVKELKLDASSVVKVVNHWIDDALQRKDEHRVALTELLILLHGDGCCPAMALNDALRPFLQDLADMKTDMPKLDIWLAQIMAGLITEGALGLEHLQTLPQPMIEDGLAGDYAVKVLLELKSQIGAEEIRQRMEGCQFDLKALLPPDLADDPETEVTALLGRLAL